MHCEDRIESPGSDDATGIMTLGYDAARKRFIGAFIRSMMTHPWIYEAHLDPAAKVLTLDTEGPSFTSQGKTAKCQDLIEIKSAEHRVLSARCLGDDGNWRHFMTANYRRKKK